MADFNRRMFLAGATGATVAMASGKRLRAADANDTVVLAIMGANNRGSQLVEGFSKQRGAEIAYICDCDDRAMAKGIETAAAHFGKKPLGVKDFRKALDDPAVDALVCAAPNHWHAAATILACAAGKHVYVEKPASHTPEEGERMIAAARSGKRVVQVGLQRRSSPLYHKVFQRIREGAIGRALYANGLYFAERPSVGHREPMAPPPWLDYDLWQGPAPERPYRDNVVHYQWHFFWHWGNGELGNNGVHLLDVCRQALGVDYPSQVTAAGSKLRYEDDQETPDTSIATFECDGRTIVWEGISWARRNDNKSQIGMTIRGENGEIYVDDSGYKLFDPKGKVVEGDKLSRGDEEHLRNFLDGIRDGTPLNGDIEEGHKSTLFCHLGNMAYRTGQTLKIDPTNGHIIDNAAAQALWAREYREGWIPKA